MPGTGSRYSLAEAGKEVIPLKEGNKGGNTLWPHWRYAAWGLSTDFPINWSIDGLLDNSLHQLARLAASIWPYWYGDGGGVLRHTATTINNTFKPQRGGMLVENREPHKP